MCDSFYLLWRSHDPDNAFSWRKLPDPSLPRLDLADDIKVSRHAYSLVMKPSIFEFPPTTRMFASIAGHSPGGSPERL